MPYAIAFDFPDEDDVMFAGRSGDKPFVSSLKAARRWIDEDEAESALSNSYGLASRAYAAVVEIEI